MLDSLRQQTFKDYEAWIVNDGSTDDTQTIAEEFAQNDLRFHVIQQENQGVSAARNHGMERACGTYLIFFDGDDWIPPQALENLLQSIQMEAADMAVGILETVSDGKREVNQASEFLAGQKIIDPADPAFIKTWSQCNKMYRRGFLEEHAIRFIPVKVAEDGHFLYQVLAKKPKICGCNALVYRYLRSPFWEGLHTASKKVDHAYLTDRLQVYGDMLHMIELLFLERNQEDYAAYRDRLVTRFLKGGIIQAFYRRIWRCDDALEPELAEAMQRFVPVLTEECWRQLIREEWDIPLERIVRGEAKDVKQHFCTTPQISIIFGRLAPREIMICLDSLINQEFPSFEVFLDENIRHKIDRAWGDLPNVHCISREEYEHDTLSQMANGRYICWIDTPMIFPVHALKRMVDALENERNLDFLSVYIRPVDIKNQQIKINGNGAPLQSMEAVFGPFKRQKRVFGKIGYLDNRLANKLFRISAVERACVCGMSYCELMSFYQQQSFKRIRNAWIMADLTDQELLEHAEPDIGVSTVKAQALCNRAIRWIGHKIRGRK